MKPKFRSSVRLSLPSVIAIASLLAPTLGLGATFTYTVPDAFTTGDNNWSTDPKWSAVPLSASDTSLVFTLQATGNAQIQTTGAINDITTANPGNAFQLNTMTFNSGPSAGSGGGQIVALNISGNPLDFVSNGATTPVINLNGNRSAGQIVNFNVSNNVALAAGTVFTGGGTATFNFSGELSGSAFTKSGNSTLTLSGANTYTGNTTLSAGGLTLGNNSALSSGELNVTGTSRVNGVNAISIANKINVGANTLTLALPSTTAATATFSGQLTGDGIINIGGSGSGNNQTNLDFTNTNNTFTGNVVGASGNVSGADYFRFASIGDGGNFTFQKSGNRGGVIYNGASAIEFDVRQIAIGAGFGGATGLNGNGIPQNSFANNATNAAHTVTFNSDLSVGAITSSSFFFFDGSNTGDNTFAGDIGDATGANTLGIGKTGAGRWVLTGSNSYEGNTNIFSGTLAVNTIDVVANNQSLGKGSLIQFGNAATTGTLEFIGSTNSTTDRQVVIGNANNNHAGGAIILNNGDGTLSFTNTTFNSLPGTVTTVDRTLTLGGSNTGANTISGTIQDNNITGTNNAWVGITKSGAGTWVLDGDNSYTGTTGVTEGTLLINGNSSTATGAVTVAAAGTLGGIGTVGGNTTVNGTLSPGQSPGTLTFAGNLTINAAATYVFESGDQTNVNGTLDLNNDWNLTLSGLGFQDGGSLILFDYVAIAADPDLTPSNINLVGLGFTPSESLTLTDTGSAIVLNGISAIPEPSAALLGCLGVLALLRRRR